MTRTQDDSNTSTFILVKDINRERYDVDALSFFFYLMFWLRDYSFDCLFSDKHFYRKSCFLFIAFFILRPATNVKTTPGTRDIHQIQRVSDYEVRYRSLACFCPSCRGDGGVCQNISIVGGWKRKVLQLLKK